MSSLQVAVLSGGLSLERDVSLRSGTRVANALEERGHRVDRIDLDDHLVTSLLEGGYDVVFLALHGKAGEDGSVQGLLQLLGIPYTGPDATASALAWDKNVFKGLLARRGLPTPDWVALSSSAIRNMGAARALDRVSGHLGLPLMVKPSQGGASMGVRRVDAADELGPALVTAYSYHEVVLVERFIKGTEIAISIVDGEPLPAVEVVPRDGAYDFAARYTHGATDFYAPARLDDDVLQHAKQVALDAYEAVGCRHVTRADLVVDADGGPWLLELDTCPGLTETSLLPTAAGAAGISFTDLCERLVQRALVSN